MDILTLLKNAHFLKNRSSTRISSRFPYVCMCSVSLPKSVLYEYQVLDWRRPPDPEGSRRLVCPPPALGGRLISVAYAQRADSVCKKPMKSAGVGWVDWCLISTLCRVINYYCEYSIGWDLPRRPIVPPMLYSLRRLIAFVAAIGQAQRCLTRTSAALDGLDHSFPAHARKRNSAWTSSHLPTRVPVV